MFVVVVLRLVGSALLFHRPCDRRTVSSEHSLTLTLTDSQLVVVLRLMRVLARERTSLPFLRKRQSVQPADLDPMRELALSLLSVAARSSFSATPLPGQKLNAPLMLLRDITSLRFSAMLSFAMVMYVACVIVWRSVQESVTDMEKLGKLWTVLSSQYIFQ